MSESAFVEETMRYYVTLAFEVDLEQAEGFIYDDELKSDVVKVMRDRIGKQVQGALQDGGMRPESITVQSEADLRFNADLAAPSPPGPQPAIRMRDLWP